MSGQAKDPRLHGMGSLRTKGNVHLVELEGVGFGGSVGGHFLVAIQDLVDEGGLFGIR